MRESNYKVVGSNKSCILITSSVYDRRALDSTHDRPLVNSLNHLTYLTSTSSKVRESLCNDGGLERLVAILQECMKSQKLKLYNREKSIAEEKEDALIAWKWTLAFQCLVLIGTRGSETIRKRVVEAGLIPILATVLDNYLLLYRDLDSLRDCTLESGLLESLIDFVKENDIISSKEMIQKRLEMKSSDIFSLLEAKPNIRPWLETTLEEFPPVKKWRFEGFEPEKEEGDSYLSRNQSYEERRLADFSENHNPSTATLIEESGSDQLDFPIDSLGMVDPHSSMRSRAKLSKTDNSLLITTQTIQKNLHDINNQISSPRIFFNGTLIPKDDDVVWSLQLLAFISKYSSLKRDLQDTTLINSLSLRYLLKCSHQTYEEYSSRPGTALIPASFKLENTSPVLPFSYPHQKSYSPHDQSGLTSSAFSKFENGLNLSELESSASSTPLASTTHSSSSNFHTNTSSSTPGYWRGPNYHTSTSVHTPASLMEDDPQDLSQSYMSQVEPLTQTQSILSLNNSSDHMVEFASSSKIEDSNDLTTMKTDSPFNFETLNKKNRSVSTDGHDIQEFDKEGDLVIGANENVMDREQTLLNFVVEDDQLSPDSGSIIDQDRCFADDDNPVDSLVFETGMDQGEFDNRKNEDIMEGDKMRNKISLISTTSTETKDSTLDHLFLPTNLKNTIRNFEKAASPTTTFLPKLTRAISICFDHLLSKLNDFYCSKEVVDFFNSMTKSKEEKKIYLCKWNYKTYFCRSEDINVIDLDESKRLKLHLNIFPVVEKFTNKSDNTSDLSYWSGVIMRNSCRKDEVRGGVRQCAYSKCGKWEDFPRQFAKCRRCKRTKYCSKQCQLQAWGFHKYWCVDSSTSSTSSGSNATTTGLTTTTLDAQGNQPEEGQQVLGGALGAQQQMPPQPQVRQNPIMGGLQAQLIQREGRIDVPVAPNADQQVLQAAFQIDPDQIQQFGADAEVQFPPNIEQDQADNQIHLNGLFIEGEQLNVQQEWD